MCVIEVVGAAPCQCFSFGANNTASPGRISSIGPPQHCARPQPAVTTSLWPNGRVCSRVWVVVVVVSAAQPARKMATRPRNVSAIRFFFLCSETHTRRSATGVSSSHGIADARITVDENALFFRYRRAECSRFCRLRQRQNGDDSNANRPDDQASAYPG